jgi:predicted O-methyltransferase YrrM
MSQFSRQVIRPLQNLWDDWASARDARELAELGLLNAEFERGRALAAEQLQPAYEQYVNGVSSSDMAVSWETACLIYALAGVLRPREILDLGSGFSSYVLRTYATTADHECQVTSVDDHRHWLKQTENYLAQHGLPTDRVLHWDDFCQTLPTGRFDLVFHDLGNMDTRAMALPTVLQTLTPTGVLVLDDMHKRRYRQKAERHAESQGWRLLSARTQTLDPIGRYSKIALRRSA